VASNPGENGTGWGAVSPAIDILGALAGVPVVSTVAVLEREIPEGEVPS